VAEIIKTDDSTAPPDGLSFFDAFFHANRESTPYQVRGSLSLEHAIEDISADRYAGSTKLHRSRDQRTSSVTATGTNSDVTSALKLIAMPANTPATAST
jgi:hypothetical protein